MNTTPSAMIARIDLVASYISKIGIYISCALLVFITIIIFVNVILRSFFQYNLPFVEEWASLSLVPMSYLGLGYTLRKDKHIAADILIRKLSDKAKYICLLFVSIVALAVLLFYTEGAWDLFIYQFERNVTTNGSMRTPLWIASITVFIGLAIFLMDVCFWILHFILKLCGKKGLAFD